MRSSSTGACSVPSCSRRARRSVSAPPSRRSSIRRLLFGRCVRAARARSASPQRGAAQARLSHGARARAAQPACAGSQRARDHPRQRPRAVACRAIGVCDDRAPAAADRPACRRFARREPSRARPRGAREAARAARCRRRARGQAIAAMDRRGAAYAGRRSAARSDCARRGSEAVGARVLQSRQQRVAAHGSRRPHRDFRGGGRRNCQRVRPRARPRGVGRALERRIRRGRSSRRHRDGSPTVSRRAASRPG